MIRVEKGVVAVPAQGPAHPQQLQDWPDNLQHASLHYQLPPAACRKAQLQLLSFTFYDVHGVSERQTIPSQWPWQTAAAALVPAGHTKMYSSQLVLLIL